MSEAMTWRVPGVTVQLRYRLLIHITNQATSATAIPPPPTRYVEQVCLYCIAVEGGQVRCVAEDGAVRHNGHTGVGGVQPGRNLCVCV